MSTKAVKRLTRSEQREKNRRDLVGAAREVLLSEGVAAAQVDAIAARVGLTKGAVYSIFGSKVDLLLAVVEHHVPTPAIEGPDAEAALASLTDTYLAVPHDPEARQMLLLEVELILLALRTPELLSRLRALHDRRTSELGARLAALPRRDGSRLTEEQASAVVRTAVAMLQGVLQLAVMGGWSPVRAQAHAAVQALLPGSPGSSA